MYCGDGVGPQSRRRRIDARNRTSSEVQIPGGFSASRVTRPSCAFPRIESTRVGRWPTDAFLQAKCTFLCSFVPPKVAPSSDGGTFTVAVAPTLAALAPVNCERPQKRSSHLIIVAVTGDTARRTECGAKWRW